MTPRRWKLAGVASLLVVAAVVAVGVVLAGGGESAQPVVRAGAGSADESSLKPPLELSGVDPFTGKQVSLDDYEGKPVVLNFWASWCPPCREELPALVRFAEAHPEAAVVGILYQDAPSDASRLRSETDATFATISDPRGEIGARLGLQGMPTTYFLDADHRAVAVITGGTDLAGFEEGLRVATRGS